MDPFSAENPPVCNQEIGQYFYTMNIRSSHKFARNFFNGRMEGVQKLYGGECFFNTRPEDKILHSVPKKTRFI